MAVTPPTPYNSLNRKGKMAKRSVALPRSADRVYRRVIQVDQADESPALNTLNTFSTLTARLASLRFSQEEEARINAVIAGESSLKPKHSPKPEHNSKQKHDSKSKYCAKPRHVSELKSDVNKPDAHATPMAATPSPALRAPVLMSLRAIRAAAVKSPSAATVKALETAVKAPSVKLTDNKHPILFGVGEYPFDIEANSKALLDSFANEMDIVMDEYLKPRSW